MVPDTMNQSHWSRIHLNAYLPSVHVSNLHSATPTAADASRNVHVCDLLEERRAPVRVASLKGREGQEGRQQMALSVCAAQCFD